MRLRCAAPSTIAASTTWPCPLVLRLEERGEDADDEVRRPAAEVADEVAREVRPAGVLAEAVEDAGDRDVVHVVAGGLGQRAVLAPAGHPAVDQPRVAGQALVGADAEPLGDAGAHALDEHVGLRDELHERREGVGVLEVHRHARPAAGEQVGLAGSGAGGAAGLLDADHVGPEVGEDRRRVRPRTDAGDLDDLDALERARSPGSARTSASQPCGRGIATGIVARPVDQSSTRRRNRRVRSSRGAAEDLARAGPPRAPGPRRGSRPWSPRRGRTPSRGWRAPSWCPPRPACAGCRAPRRPAPGRAPRSPRRAAAAPAGSPAPGRSPPAAAGRRRAGRGGRRPCRRARTGRAGPARRSRASVGATPCTFRGASVTLSSTVRCGNRL